MSTVHPVIERYYYTYGAGEEMNRQIEFLRTIENDPSSLEAHISGKRDDAWLKSSVVLAKDISVELMSTSEKMHQIMEARQQQLPTPDFITKTIDQFDIAEQNAILGSLKPKGLRELEMTNQPGGEHGLEAVESITIYDLS